MRRIPSAFGEAQYLARQDLQGLAFEIVYSTSKLESCIFRLGPALGPPTACMLSLCKIGGSEGFERSAIHKMRLLLLLEESHSLPKPIASRNIAEVCKYFNLH